ncbi:MAG: slipin family protein [Gordonia sp. (in: high G+C Gram-positive bacteria)]|uniref:slipin family protein n=1 Tax=Gordonia sp. (in: high G+C Gram-positive bacteria) TaxID=84139 RepID=UPI003C7642EB
MSFITTITGRKLFVPAGHRAVVYSDGTEPRVLDPGTHRIPGDATVQVVSIRERILSLAPQEITTAEAATIRVSAAAMVRVINPVRFIERAESPDSVVYLAVQVALRDAIAGLAVEELLSRSTRAIDLSDVRAAAVEAGASVGLEVRDVVVKDLIVPHELRSAALELLTAKTRGEARLAEARAETAALRALANAGRMLDASPALAQLRMVQAAPYGTKIVIGLGETAAVVAD